ncbi:hypothetical protein Hypma_010921 [Hypsizygus marmoreus]|uniref:Uncharacterized protein n=1 Tax=Hypsizygus marmoreus TaxID=39966 RepID=A0A369JSL3_HYPMA|nr:hypothetical protein Hypma_010921 [Hypsizygus marmoreus]
MCYSDIRPYGPHLPEGYEARRPIFDVRGWSYARDQIKRAIQDFQFQSVAVKHLPFIADIVDETCLVAEDAIELSPVAELAPAVRLVLHIWSILQLVSSNKEANFDLIANCAALISVLRKAGMTRHPGIIGALADPIKELIWVLTGICHLFEEHLSSSWFTRYVKRDALKREVRRCEERIGYVQQLCLMDLMILRCVS